MDESDRRLVVDAMNVIGSRPTGWWRDRDQAVRDLAARIHRYAEGSGRVVGPQELLRRLDEVEEA